MCDSTGISMEKNNGHIDFNLLTRFLAGELGIEEQKLVKDWIDSSDKNRNEFDELQNAWNAIDKTSRKQEIDTEKEWKYHQSLILIPRSHRLPS